MSLQHESNTVQTVVNQTEDSPPRMTISRRLSVMVEKMKAALVGSNWMLVLHTVSRWVVGLSLILAISVFTYIALYSSLMPREVQLTNNIIISVIVAGFRFTKKTSTSSSATALTGREPAVIPT